MKKTVIIGGIIVLILLIIFFVAGPKSGGGILASESSLLRYQVGLPAATSAAQVGDGITDYGFLSYNFNKSADGDWYAQGFIDANGDGTFSDNEWVVKNEPAHVVKDFPNRFSVTLPDSLKTSDAPKTVPVMIALTDAPVDTALAISKDNSHTLDAAVETTVIDDEFGLNVPGSSADLKRGVGIVNYAHAQETNTGVDSTNLPDFSGGPMDCFAIATANNLINMATEHGRRDDLPDPQELIRELKDAMQWNNGILNRNFLTGKAQFVHDLDLPIETEEIKRPTINDLKRALASGDGVEISTSMIRSSTHDDTGHVLTGVSAASDGSSVSVHDPATPQGNDSLHMSMTGGATPFILLSYPMWDGIMIVDAIYIQHWKEPQTSTEKTGTTVDEQKPQTESTTGTSADTTQTSQEPIMKKTPKLEGSFAHVKPGEYSEVYAVVTGLTPGDTIKASMTGPGYESPSTQEADADENGVAHFTWRIHQYGDYDISATGKEIGYGEAITVDVH